MTARKGHRGPCHRQASNEPTMLPDASLDIDFATEVILDMISEDIRSAPSIWTVGMPHTIWEVI